MTDSAETRTATVSDVEVITPREVPLGGIRAMTVRRTLPTRSRTLIGAWCFLDHYGPDEVTESGGMLVPPHPHTGLQTVSWLFAGEVEHRDSGGHHAVIRPGEIALMTSGYGIAHSEVSTPGTEILHGVQLWVALPQEALTIQRTFSYHPAPTVNFNHAIAIVFIGELAGAVSDVPTYTPLLGAEILLEPYASIVLPVNHDFEHGVLVDTSTVQVQDTQLHPGELGYIAPGKSALTIRNMEDQHARLILLGGTPFEEQIVMWWNFVARSHEEIVLMRDQWQAEDNRFGRVEGFVGDVNRLDAPPMPRVRLMPRGNPPRD
jgi:redox-sensitive bicupin YhaK (pirin superfamily)